MKEINFVQKYHFNKTIGRYLRRIRRSAGFSRSQVILAAELSQRQLCDYETGAIPLPANLFAKLVGLCNADCLEANAAIHKASQFLKIH